ncbi:unnamed protein product [Lactuca saligna]|uniref:peptidylprolyl isomerase n=1 Tax=Lactuca saligna TaxID=75948 RepID=A0AA35ZXN1_LACSI|nr:unnamed protein product [Lactuca saligna]
MLPSLSSSWIFSILFSLSQTRTSPSSFHRAPNPFCPHPTTSPAADSSKVSDISGDASSEASSILSGGRNALVGIAGRRRRTNVVFMYTLSPPPRTTHLNVRPLFASIFRLVLRVTHLPATTSPSTSLTSSFAYLRWVEPISASICCHRFAINLYKFILDGEWRHDEHQPFVTGNYGVVNTILLAREPVFTPLVLTPHTTSASTMDVDNEGNMEQDVTPDKNSQQGCGGRQSDQLYTKDITPDDKQELDESLRIEIEATFRTDEIRRTPPTRQDEMRAGMCYFHLMLICILLLFALYLHHLQVELLSWIIVLDVCKDGGILKRVVNNGEHTGQPGYMDEVKVKYVVKLTDRVIISESPKERVEFYLKDAINAMTREEKVDLTVQPQYAFGEDGVIVTSIPNGFSQIPPNYMLHVALELIVFFSHPKKMTNTQRFFHVRGPNNGRNRF